MPARLGQVLRWTAFAFVTALTVACAERMARPDPNDVNGCIGQAAVPDAKAAIHAAHAELVRVSPTPRPKGEEEEWQKTMTASLRAGIWEVTKSGEGGFLIAKCDGHIKGGFNLF